MSAARTAEDLLLRRGLMALQGESESALAPAPAQPQPQPPPGNVAAGPAMAAALRPAPWAAVLGEPLDEQRRQAAIHCIELEALRLLRLLVQRQGLELVVPKASLWHAAEPAEAATTRVRFDAPASQRKFTVIVMLLSRVHKLLSTRSTGTRRQFYYEEVAFLKSQREVDVGALSVSRMVGLPPWHLGLFATAKGLIAGDLILTTTDGEVLDCRSKPGGVLIPGDAAAIGHVQSSARFVLVLEKDTIFQRVLQEGVLDRLHPCIIVTGKGYPDVSTRVLLARLEAELRVPMLALMDADPHGVHIMSVYRFGTKTCPLALRSLRWLGLLPTEVASLGVRAAPLTDRDVALARRLLDKDSLRDAPAILHEVETLLSQGTKAEVDALIEFAPCYLTDVYLPSKIAAANVL